MKRSSTAIIIAVLLAAGLYVVLSFAPDPYTVEVSDPVPAADAGSGPAERPSVLAPAPDDDAAPALGSNPEPDSEDCVWELVRQLPREEQLNALGGRMEAALAAARTLVASPDPEHRFAAYLLARRRTTTDDETGGEIQVAPIPEPDPASPLQLWLALNHCQQPAVDFSSCRTEPMEQALLAVDGTNSEAWAMAAIGRYGRGDAEGALAALQQAGAASESNSYWIETLQLVDRALLAATDYDYTSRATLAIGSTDQSITGFQAILAMCNDTYETDDTWTRACDSYGALIERRHDTQWGREIGVNLRLASATRLGYVLPENQAETESTSLRSPRRIAVDRMIVTNPTYMSRYLAAIPIEGQQAAEDLLIEEDLPPLLEQLGMSACAADIR